MLRVLRAGATQVLGGQLAWYQGLTNLFAQLLGSMAGAGLLCVMFPCAKDMSGMTLGTNIIADGFDVGNILMAEILGTFILCFVVWETAAGWWFGNMTFIFPYIGE